MAKIIFILFLFNAQLEAADIALHSAQGFALHYGLAKLLTDDRNVQLFAGLTGAVTGILPDLPPSNSQLRFDIYYGNAEKGMKFVPGFALHLLVDKAFHKNPNEGHWGENWRLVALDVALWLGTLWVIKKLLQ